MNCVLPNSYAEIPTPDTSECNLFGDFKEMSLRVGFNPT
jgi:hypothetical protein